MPKALTSKTSSPQMSPQAIKELMKELKKKRKLEIEEAMRLPIFEHDYPQPRSGDLHSFEIRKGRQLYYQRLYLAENQRGRPFRWAFFLADHSGPPKTTVEEIMEYIIPCDTWKKRGIVMRLMQPVGGWLEGYVSCVREGTRVRLAMSDGENAAGEKFEFVFPLNPDTLEGYMMHTLEYSGEKDKPSPLA